MKKIKKNKRRKKARKAGKENIPGRNRREKELLDLIEKRPADYSIVLQLAEHYLNSGQPVEAYRTARPIWGRVAKDDKELYLFLCRVLAFSAAETNRLEEAEEYGTAGLDECAAGLDFHFVLSINCARRQAYEAAVAHASEYFKIWEKLKETGEIDNRRDKSFGLRHQLLNACGVAFVEMSEPDKAEHCFQEALSLVPEYDSTYINYSILLESLGRHEEARNMIEKGRIAAPSSQELKNISGGAAKNRPTVSACMIVKNEEVFLPRCLKSIRDLVDEIILVDTGSTDRTLEIAGQFGCRIFHYPWKGDFSSARNESLRHATKDWIFIIDADEELAPGEIEKIRHFLSKPDLNVISISVYNKNLETKHVSSFLQSMRLFRRGLGIYYYGIVHNRLKIPSNMPVVRCDVKLYHYGYDLARDRLDDKIARTQALLEKQLKEHPDDVFANFNMAQLLRGFKDVSSEHVCKLILKHAGRVVNHPVSRSPEFYGQRLMAMHQMATALYHLKRYDEAEKYCHDALEFRPDYLDPLMMLAQIHISTKNLEKGKEYFLKYLYNREEYNEAREVDNIILLSLGDRHIAWYGLAAIAEAENDIEEAFRCFNKVLEVRDHYLDTYCRLGKLCLDRGELSQAEEMFRKEIGQNDKSAYAYFGLGEALSAQGNEIGAFECFEKAVEYAPDNPHMKFRLGKAGIKIGRIAEGVEHLAAISDLAPNDSELNYEAANLIFETGEIEKARDQYSIVLAERPDHIEALNNLGNCHFKTGDYEKACSTYEQLIQKAPGYPPAHRNMGLACFRMANNEKALESLIRYVNICPEDADILHVIGDLYFQAEVFDQAIVFYEKCLKISPNDSVGLLNLSEAYFRLGYYDSAAVGFKHFLSIDPDCPLARERLAALARPENIR